MAGPGLFLDRDGVVNVRLPLLVRRPEQFRFRAGVPEAIARACRAGYRVVIATNQWPAGVGILTARNLAAIHDRMVAGVEAAGGRLDAVMACVHAPWRRCGCAKPQPGMLTEAAARLDVDLSRSWMVGDQAKDLLAGRAAGCRTALVNPTRRAVLSNAAALADYVGDGVPDVVEHILSPTTHEGTRKSI